MTTVKIDTPDNVFHVSKREVCPGTPHADPTDAASLTITLHCQPVTFTARHRVLTVVSLALSDRDDVLVELDSPDLTLVCRVLSVYVSPCETRITIGPGRDVSKWIQVQGA